MRESDKFSPQAAELRFQSAQLKAQAAALDLRLAVIRATTALQGLADMLQEGVDRDLATHPDMAELNIQLDSFYG